jgi:hypothetical protein
LGVSCSDAPWNAAVAGVRNGIDIALGWDRGSICSGFYHAVVGGVGGILGILVLGGSVVGRYAGWGSDVAFGVGIFLDDAVFERAIFVGEHVSGHIFGWVAVNFSEG